MSWDPRDYDGVTYESERRERDEARALALEAEEEEMDAVHAAAAGWRRSIAIATRMKEAA
jgi:hypothetical protein